MPARPAHFPDALVGLAASAVSRSSRILLTRQASSSGLEARPAGLVQGVDHLAVDVELELVGAALPIRTGAEPS